MVLNTRSRNTDNSKREDSRKGQIDRCEIINVRPHIQPYPADKDYNTVDVQLVDRPIGEDGKYVTIERIKLNSLQTWHGRWQGCPWHGRIGDLVLVYWMSEREAVVLATIASDEQEPICRSLANDKHQEWVWKLAAWRQPIQDPITKNYIYFPPPQHPHCIKWWPVQEDGASPNLDMIFIFDCKEGHDCANCSAAAPCNGLDDHQSSTCFKHFSEFSPTQIDVPARFKFLHRCGSNWFYDDDGRVNMESHKSDHELENRIAMYPDSGYSDEHGPIACEVVNIETMALLRIYHDGAVRVRSSTDPTGETLRSELFLDADGNCWLWNGVTDNSVEILADGKIVLDGDVEITGSCTHQACSCDGTSGTGTGTGSEQQIEHGLGAAPGEVSAFCTGSGGTCVVNYCTETYIYVTCTAGVGFKWRARH